MQLPHIDPVALQIGPLAIHWYGLSWLIGVLLIWLGGTRRARRMPGWSGSQVENLVFWGFVGAFVGGRLGYVLFYNLAHYAADPLAVVRVWDGGMSFHGGLLGCSLAILLWARRRGKNPLVCFDLAALWLPLCIFTVRVGNFINGELWGRETELPWGVVFARDPEQLPRHPSQLYEALLEGVVLFALVQWVGRRKGPPDGPPGLIGGVFLLGYGTARTLVEFVREPDAQVGFDLFGWVTRGQLLSVPVLLAGLVVVLWVLLLHRRPRGR